MLSVSDPETLFAEADYRNSTRRPTKLGITWTFLTPLGATDSGRTYQNSQGKLRSMRHIVDVCTQLAQQDTQIHLQLPEHFYKPLLILESTRSCHYSADGSCGS